MEQFLSVWNIVEHFAFHHYSMEYINLFFLLFQGLANASQSLTIDERIKKKKRKQKIGHAFIFHSNFLRHENTLGIFNFRISWLRKLPETQISLKLKSSLNAQCNMKCRAIICVYCWRFCVFCVHVLLVFLFYRLF